jgi:uncharacterized membrane protein YphA (DoxX/SURF4 family)
MQTERAKVARILLVVGRLILAAIFLYAGYAKLQPQASMHWSPASVKTSLAMFAMQVDSYQMLPPSGVSFVAHALPPFEMFLGLWLLSGIALRVSSVVTSLLLTGFFSAMVRSYALHLGINCGCFGTPEQLGAKTLVRDGSLLALSLAVTVGAFLMRSRRGAGHFPEATPAAMASQETRG